MFIKFLKDTSGSTAIEYSLMIAMAGIIAIGTITLLGNEVTNLHNGVATDIDTAIN